MRAKSIPTIMAKSQPLAMVLALVVASGEAFMAPPAIPRACPSAPPAVGKASPAATRDVAKGGARSAVVAPLGASQLGSGYIVSALTDLLKGIKKVKTTLPQDPKANKADRKKELAEKQKDYRWSTAGIPVGTPYLEGFPPSEEFPRVGWVTQFVSALAKIIVGTISGTVGATEIVEALSSPARAKTFATRISQLIKDAKVDERPVDINDYEDLHQFPIKTPESVVDYEDDEAFCRQRLQGANCVVIEKCSQATRHKLKVLDSDPAYKGMKEKVDSLMKAGKLLAVDHDLLKDMESSPLDGTVERFLCPSIALFEVVDDDLLPIKPIGIQLSQKEATPIFTPADGYNWMIAKACFESADWIVHEVVSHLASTHVVLEAPMVAMNRQLPKAHPIHALLKPHLEGSAFINWGAQALLITPGGSVDRLQANSIEDTWTLTLQEVLKRIAKDFSPPEDFKARGVTVKDFPGRYPYRDYGTKYWDATYTWVKGYLDVYYTSEADVTADYELKAFVDEMVDIAQFKWLAEFNTSKDKRGLIAKVLASLIYTASTLHAAVNFPQRSILSFAPSTPGSVYVKPPTDKKERTFTEYLSYLPPLEIATVQVVVLTLLGSIYHTKLGDYDSDHFSDDRVREPLNKFQQTLEDIEIEIRAENAYLTSEWLKRGKTATKALNFAYTTLLPANIPQSTNI